MNYIGNFSKIKADWKFLRGKALKKINKDLDIVQILKKMKEIDKLKELLFDPNQRILFEFFPKPIIRRKCRAPDKKKKIIHLNNLEKGNNLWRFSKHMLQNEYLKKLVSKTDSRLEVELEIYMEVFKAYLQITNSKTGIDGKINDKLVSSLGVNILNLFRESDSISFETNENKS